MNNIIEEDFSGTMGQATKHTVMNTKNILFYGKSNKRIY
jgi:hypothetical protein